MKLLYIANVRLPTEKAHGLQIMKTCEAFSKSGIEAELVVPTRTNRLSVDPFTYYGITHRFMLTTLAVPDLVRFGSLGFFVSALWFSEKTRWLGSFWNADIIYSRDALVLLQYLLLGRTVVFEAHRRPSFAARVVARHAHRVVVISDGLRGAYEAAGVSGKKIVVAPDAVDEHLFDNVPDRMKVREALGLPLDKKIVLYAGHLYARKGADSIAEAAERLPDALFVFVGGTETDVAAFKEKQREQSNIMIVGHVTREKIPPYLRAADILMLPNSGKDEDSARFTSPMKLFEYMASGTPILASDVPALREILSDANAYFFKADDADALAHSLGRIFAHSEEAAARAKRALQDVARHTWDARAKHILDCIS